MLRSKKNVYVFTIAILLIISSCGREGADEPDSHAEESPNITEESYSNYNDKATHAAEPYQDVFYNMPAHVLSILVPDYLMHPAMGTPFRRAEESMRQMWAETGQRFELDVTTMAFDSFSYMITRLEVMMMAGDAFDMFYVIPGLHNIWRYSQAGFLADIYALMDESPNTSREDFFTNVLDAYAIDGGLYVFPLNFSLQYFAINATLPQEFIDRFIKKNTVSYAELMLMYLDLQREFGDEYGHLLISCNVGAMYSTGVLVRKISDFIDLNTRVSYLNDNSFADILANIQHVQAIGGFGIDRGVAFAGPIPDRRRRRIDSEQFIFISDSLTRHPFYVFFEPNAQYFSHHIPLANHEGGLLLNPLQQIAPAFAIYSDGESALAWEFMQHLIPVMTMIVPENINRTMAIPIKQAYLVPHFSALFEEYADLLHDHFNFLGMQDGNEREDSIHHAMERLWAFAQMPIASMPWVPAGMFEDDLDQLLRGLITPRDAAVRMHNRMALWLIE